jgi:phosphate-selective porin OprO/OprP
MKHWWIRGFCVVVCLMVGLSPALAETQKEKEMQQTIEMLIKRVEQLEQKVNELSAQPAVAPAQIEERLSKVEQSVEKKTADNAFNVFWKSGVNFETNDKKFKLKIAGRVLNDWYAGEIDGGDFEEGTRFRQAWVDLNGVVYDDFKFRFRYGFEGDGTAKWKDVWAEYTGLDAAKIRIGQFKEPMGLEWLTPQTYTTVMERSSLRTLTPGRATGLMLSNEVMNKRMTWAAGWFKNSNAFGDGDANDAVNGSWDVTARVTGVPWYEEDGRKLLHLGAAVSHREWNGDALRYRARGSFSRGDRLVDTRTFNADDIDLYTAEAALVAGPFSLQGEGVYANVEGNNFPDENYYSAYAQASYFLTGEHRPYKSGVFSRVKPKNNFSLKEGQWGAWELAARYTWLDLDDNQNGGTLDDYVLGLNWYLNPNARIMWNYVHSEANDSPDNIDEADVYQMRFQIDF